MRKKRENRIDGCLMEKNDIDEEMDEKEEDK